MENNESQEQLGFAVDLDRKTICAYEQGTIIPKLDHVFRIMEYYCVDKLILSISEDSPKIVTDADIIKR